MKVLSIRQPWAWLIVNGHKDVENRDWPTSFRGPVLIHAGKAWDDDSFPRWNKKFNYSQYHRPEFLPKAAAEALPTLYHECGLGGIVGIAEITGCVTRRASPWFFGTYGFVMANARPLPFTPLRGQLGFFDCLADVLVQLGL